MKLSNLNETVILIDTAFINEKIKELLDFYSDLYPEKTFTPIDMTQLILRFAESARIEEQGRYVDVIFAYTLENSELFFCEPAELLNEINEIKFESCIGNFYLRSFFADEDESCSQHFINILKELYFKRNVARIILIADNKDLNYELKSMFYEGNKSLFMIKNYQESEIEIEIGNPMKYVNIEYPIAYSLGLKGGEI